MVCRPVPISLPTAHEFELAKKDMRTLEQAFSPVYFSTKADGTVELGLQNLAIEAGKPVLLVGNHQTIPLDTGFHVAEVRDTHMFVSHIWMHLGHQQDQRHRRVTGHL
jgi:hypothetical protein